MKFAQILKTFGLGLMYLILLSGCRVDGDWIVNKEQVADEPFSELSMPVELFQSNLEETNYTALVYVTKARVIDRPIWPLNKLGDYITHYYEANVIETFRGGEFRKISYTVMADADIEPSVSNNYTVLSLCGSMESGFYSLGNGYSSAASHLLVDYGRVFKERNSEAKLSSECE